MTALHVAASLCPCNGPPQRISPSGSGFPILIPIPAVRAYLCDAKKSQPSLVKFQETQCPGRKLICLFF